MNTIDTPRSRLKSLLLSLVLAVLASAPLPARANHDACRFDLQMILDPAIAKNQGAAHAAITADLFNGEIIAVRHFGQDDNKHALFLVTLRARDPYTGAERYREAFFKPRVWGDEDGWARAPMEFGAYFVNRALGMDYIAPTAYRKGLAIRMDGQTYTEGAFIYRIPEFTPLEKLPHELFPENHDGIISDNRVLAVMLLNQDEHYRNLGIGRHWVDGQTRPAFIDWGASLRHGTNVTMTEYHAYGNSKPVTKIRRATLEALDRLRIEDLEPLYRSDAFITGEEASGIVARAKGIAGYFHGLLAKARAEGRPESDVLIAN